MADAPRRWWDRPRSWYDRGLAWLHLAVPAAAAGLLAAFLALAEEVGEGETDHVDRALLLAFRTSGDPADPIGPPWFEDIVRDLTALGGYGVMSLLVAGVLGLLLLWGRRRDAVLVTVSVLGSLALNSVLKDLFGRPRPDLVPHGHHVYSASFPSGHSMVSASVYLTLAAMIGRAVPQRRVQVYVLACALGVVGLIGASRVYLGVHWPTDVLAGWAAGGAWALGTWALADAWTWWRGRRQGLTRTSS